MYRPSGDQRGLNNPSDSGTVDRVFVRRSSIIRGSYRIEASHTGFQTTAQSFTLEVSQIQTIEFHLPVGVSAQTVEVTDATPVINLAISSTRSVIEGKGVTDLPLNCRNFTSLANFIRVEAMLDAVLSASSIASKITSFLVLVRNQEFTIPKERLSTVVRLPCPTDRKSSCVANLTLQGWWPETGNSKA